MASRTRVPVFGAVLALALIVLVGCMAKVLTGSVAALSLSVPFEYLEQCAPITVTFQNSRGQTSALVKEAQVTLSATQNGTFYSDARCETAITSVTAPAKSSSITVYAIASYAGTSTFSAAVPAEEFSGSLDVTLDSYGEFFTTSANLGSISNCANWCKFSVSVATGALREITRLSNGGALASCSDGTQGYSYWTPAGRFSTFVSDCNTDGFNYVYRKDAVTGALDITNTRADGARRVAYNGAMSADGRYVLIASDAPDLVTGDTNGLQDIFLKDMNTGSIRRISLSSAGTQGNNASYLPGVSGDGLKMIYTSVATNLVTGDTNGFADLFLTELPQGTTTRIGVSTAGVAPNADIAWGQISSDGRFVVFLSGASNLVSGDTNGFTDVFVRDLTAGTTERVSLSSAGAQANGQSAITMGGAISWNGRYVVFTSSATNLVTGDTNAQDDVFVRDRLLGTTTRVSISTQGAQANSFIGNGVCSHGGRYVFFDSDATNLVTGDTNASTDIFVHDRVTGTTRQLSRNAAGQIGNGTSSLMNEI